MLNKLCDPHNIFDVAAILGYAYREALITALITRVI